MPHPAAPPPILLVEDDDNDALLIERHLIRGGFEAPALIRVQSLDALRQALNEHRPPVLLCDFQLPGFTALDVIALAKAEHPDVAVVVFSGSVGEESAVEVMRAGAKDYLLKTSLARLGEVMRRELSEAESLHRRRVAERALAEQESLLRRAFHATRMGSWGWDIATGAVTWSPEVSALFGIEPGDFGGTFESYKDHLPPDALETMTDALTPVLAGETDTLYAVHRVEWPDKSIRWLESRGLAERRENGEAFRMTGTVADVTERHSLREQLMHAQKTEAMGRLAGGVAHDFNNLLTVMRSSIDLIRADVSDQHLVRDMLEALDEATERATSLTRQLLVFARRDVTRPEPIDVGMTLEKTARLLERLVDDDIEVSTEVAAGAFVVRMDRSQLEQVIVNLAVNARDAMPSGGHLALSLHEATGPSGCPEVCLDVRDTGTGMPPELLSRALEPFFTTKAVGQGTGLGLSTCDSIVRHAGGRLSIESDEGAGTTVRVHLPLSEAKAARTHSEQPSVARGSGERILLVEDDRAVREAAYLMLSHLGYAVEAMPSAADALGYIASNPLPEAIVTDVVMPGMNGVQMIAEIHEQAPEVPVLFTSGYTGDLMERHGLRPEDVTFLSKPYSKADLAAAVQGILGKDAPPSPPAQSTP